MRKNLFSIATMVASLFLLSSCSKDDNKINVDNVSNEKVLEVVDQNYYWPAPSNPNTSLSTPEFFASMLNPEDKTSWIAKTNTLSTSNLDIGFEYGAVRYSDGKIYYVIYYVKPNTSAFNVGLQRGYMISLVNGQPITEDNKSTLLANATKKGDPVKLQVFYPLTGKYIDYDITPSNINIADENPILETPDTNPILEAGNSKVGYFVYNLFLPKFDAQLIQKLQSFAGQVDYLVVDLRYNVGGNYLSTITLGSALVKNRSTQDVFLINDKRIESVPYKLLDATSGSQIPKLGDQLKKVYVITGQNTQGMPNVFIHALKAYLGDNLIVVGEKSIPTNVTVINSTIDSWTMSLLTGKWANKNNNSVLNTTPNILINDVNPNEVDVLQPLGSPKERILATILNDIQGVPASTRSQISEGSFKVVSPSLSNKANRSLNAIDFK